MGLASFVKLFTPKDRVFYGLFEDVANVLSEMAVIFTAAIDEQDQDKRNALLKRWKTWSIRMMKPRIRSSLNWAGTL